MYPHNTTWRPLTALAGFVGACMLATTTVTVESGDTLSELAQANEVSVAQLVEWNRLDDPDRILAGAMLRITAPPAPASAPDGGRYTVEPGDTLSGIAQRFGTSVARLVRANGLDDADRIVSGRSLRLDDASPAPAPVAAPEAGVADVVRHTVVAGDTLTSIAAAHGMKAGLLARHNDLADPDRIYVGQVITIGGSPSAPSPAEPAATTTTTTPTATTAPPTTTTTVPAEPAAATAPAPTIAPPAAVTSPGADLPLSNLFAQWSDAYAVPRDLLEALLWKESDWQPTTVGPNGHLGIGQLAPGTIEFIETRLLGHTMDPLDASDGIQTAARYLRYLIDRTGSDREALAAWKQGLSGVKNDGISDTAGAFADAVLEIRRQRG